MTRNTNRLVGAMLSAMSAATLMALTIPASAVAAGQSASPVLVALVASPAAHG